MSVVAFVPGTCGELLQGVDARGPLLVSLPIDLYGTVRVTLIEESVVSVVPALPKAMAAVQLAMERCRWRGGVRVELGGELPHSRGMGSSTADVAGVIAAVCAAAGVALSERDLLGLMLQVEPSDSSPLRGLWAVDHVRGTRAVRVGAVPAGMHVAMVDGGVAVDTVDVHRCYGAGPRIPDDVLAGVRWDSVAEVGRVATESAQRNQVRLPSAMFGTACGIAERIGAGGVCVAHSGSVCGVICEGRGQAERAFVEFARQQVRARIFRAVAPGVRTFRTPASPARIPPARPDEPIALPEARPGVGRLVPR